jgi:organic hydroperoxide reductase OsmC/OhrA
MPVRVKRREYAVALDRAGVMTAEGDEPLETGGGWTPEHLLLAAVARCGLNALNYHARRSAIDVDGAATAKGTIAPREEDGKYAFVEVESRLEVELTPLPEENEVRTLLARAERGCFIGSSLTAPPRYSWIVNGQEIS